MSECTHNCETCEQNCSERKESFLEAPHRLSNIKKVIGIVSGKGGVGKSSVTSMMAVLTNRDGFKTAILDADITKSGGSSVTSATKVTKTSDHTL
ncbi:MAG: P-loop NTPase, partial [Clostridia bacterium]|nr:P-loop NTPase [Clostridia bacterium]